MRLELCLEQAVALFELLFINKPLGFLDLSLSDSLATLRTRIAERLNRPPPAAFRPHLSLGYGACSAVFPDVEITDFIVANQLQNFSLDRIATVCSSKTIPIEDWSVLDHMALA